MEISQRDFFILLLYSGMCGGFLGIIYELFRAIRVAFVLALAPFWLPPVKLFGKNISVYRSDEAQIEKINTSSRETPLARVLIWLITFLGDIIYMFVWAVTVISVSYALNGGRIRWMVYVGLLVGFAFYRLTFGKAVKSMLLTVMILINNLIRKINRACLGVSGRIIKKIKSIPLNKQKRKKEKQGGKTCCE